jgi:S-adenosylmethionine decarboxylase proenzyme
MESSDHMNDVISLGNAKAIDHLTRPPFGGLGTHFLADYHGCQALPDCPEDLQRLMVRAAEAIDATIVNASFHEFSPQGLSGVLVIAESHLAVHTWPEHGVACVDLFTCS